MPARGAWLGTGAGVGLSAEASAAARPAEGPAKRQSDRLCIIALCIAMPAQKTVCSMGRKSFECFMDQLAWLPRNTDIT